MIFIPGCCEYISVYIFRGPFYERFPTFEFNHFAAEDDELIKSSKTWHNKEVTNKLYLIGLRGCFVVNGERCCYCHFIWDVHNRLE